MATVHLIRHGEAAAGWDQDADPGLSDLGWLQADEVKQHFCSAQRSSLISSPMRRARETAQPLAHVWGIDVSINPAFAEIPSPREYTIAQRLQWLLALRNDSWDQCNEDILAWRGGILTALQQISQDTIVFTHFMVLNTAFGAATGSNALVCYQPDNGSILTLNVSDGEIALVQRGREASGRVL